MFRAFNAVAATLDVTNATIIHLRINETPLSGEVVADKDVDKTHLEGKSPFVQV